MKSFDNEWICQVFEDHPSFFTKRMFGGLAVYLFGRQMMLLVEPTKTGRWNWHGVLICTEYVHQPAIVEEFPHLAPHDILKKWLYIDSVHDDFEGTMERVAVAVARDDPRFGIHPQPRKARKKKAGSRKRRQKTVTSLVVALLSVPVLAQVEQASGPVQADDLTSYAGTYTIETPGVAKANYLFMGGVYVAGVNWYEPTPPREGRFLPPTIGKPPDSYLTLARDRSRHAIIQGTDDPVATYVPSLWDVIKNGGFRTFEYLSVEGLGHGLPDAEWLDKALAVLDTPLRDGAAK